MSSPFLSAHKSGAVIGHILRRIIIWSLLLVHEDTRENIPSRSLDKVKSKFQTKELFTIFHTSYPSVFPMNCETNTEDRNLVKYQIYFTTNDLQEP